MQPAPGTETAGDDDRQGTDSAALASEGGLVGRVAQVGRQIVRSLLHTNEHGHEEAPAADAGDQGEHLDQEQAVGVVAAVAELAGTAVEAGEGGSIHAGGPRPGLEHQTLAEVAADVAAEGAQADQGPSESHEMSGLQTAASPISAEAAMAQINTEQPEVTQEEVPNQAEVPAVATEAVQVEESGHQSDPGNQDEAPAAAAADTADIADTEVEQVAATPSFTAPEEVAAGELPQDNQKGFADLVDNAVAADVVATAFEVGPEEDTGLGHTQGEAVAGADTAMAADDEIRARADAAAADFQPAAMPPVAPAPATPIVGADALAAEAGEVLVFADGAAADETPATDAIAAAGAAQTQEAGQEAPSDQAPRSAPDAAPDADAEADPAQVEPATEAPADAAQGDVGEAEARKTSLPGSYTRSDPEQALIAAAAAVQVPDEGRAGRGRVDAERGLGVSEHYLAAAAAAAADKLGEGNAAGGAHDQAQEAGAVAEEAGGKGFRPFELTVS